MKKNEEYYIRWLPDYTVGVDEIDNQHKDLLNFVNHTLYHCNGNAESEQKYFEQMVEKAIENLRTHFSTEEKIMEAVRYDNFTEHKNEHDSMLKKIKTKVDEIRKGKEELNLLMFALSLRYWILDHIPKFDKPAALAFQKGARIPKKAAAAPA